MKATDLEGEVPLAASATRTGLTNQQIMNLPNAIAPIAVKAQLLRENLPPGVQTEIDIAAAKVERAENDTEAAYRIGMWEYYVEHGLTLSAREEAAARAAAVAQSAPVKPA